MDMKPQVQAVMRHLANMELKPKNDTVYSKWIEDPVKHLASHTVEIASRTIMGFLGEYGRGVLRKEVIIQDAYSNILTPDIFLGDFSWAIDTTIKENKYARFKTPPAESTDKDVAREVSKKALQLNYEDAINFMGEIAGAWVLTYPIISLKKEKYVAKIFHSKRGWPRKEEDYVFILRRDLETEIFEWYR